MRKDSGEKVSRLAVNLIDEQLQTLTISILAILQPSEIDHVDLELVAGLLQRKSTRPKTGSGGNIVAEYASAASALDFRAATHALQENPLQRMDYLRVVMSNALLAIGAFFQQHDIAAMRTPEVQFLGHIFDAILNANTFDIEPGYMPIATFDGLVIDSRLSGFPLFGDGIGKGFMTLGDAVALLQWLSRYLRGDENFVSGGDAG